MCGIVAIVSRPAVRPAPAPGELLALLDRAVAAPTLADAVPLVGEVDRLLHGVPGMLALIGRSELIAGIGARLDQLDGRIADLERSLDAATLSADEIEDINAELLAARDGVWAVRKDRLRTADAVANLAGRDAAESAVAGYLAIQQALSAIDRMEVRGRDSAGIHVLVWGHGLNLTDPSLAALVAQRNRDPLFQSGSVRVAGDRLGFVYKAAAEIGELGDNVKALRAAVNGDALLRLALTSPAARVSVLGHTRWASVGIISEPNCHPVNGEQTELTGSSQHDQCYTVAVLNGDVDNHADIKVNHSLRIAGPITTDAKVIPAVMALHARDGGNGVRTDLAEAFRRTVAEFEGSVAIAAASGDAPEQVFLALRGSGQALYLGIGDDMFIVASEPYGVVEETAQFLRVDGETASPSGSRGQVFVIDGAKAGSLEGIRRMAYDGTDLPLSASELVTAQVTTRDIDRGDAPHFLLKEICEAPNSFRKTLRAKIVDTERGLRADVGERSLPAAIAQRLADGTITKVRIIGQGTAAVAGRSMAAVLDVLTDEQLDIDDITATELSGFHLRLDMSDTLIVAVSQSGTTTDTNRTVDLARGRGALVLAIVNRRNSDLTDKADGVMYTSDGRDVEMSVASTKAFYAQVAAGVLLACAIAEAAGKGTAQRRSDILRSLRALPEAMSAVIATRPAIAEAARRFAPPKRYWAIVGSGPNVVAAEEVRIKLSELCYKSIACDVTEDKKHIDLSSEPLILVCAAGLVGGTADDVAKEVAIYKAHKATPIVVATEGDGRFAAAAAVLTVPSVDPALAFVLSAMVGHLFGYEAALAIDASARPLREAREVIDHALAAHEGGDDVLRTVRSNIGVHAEKFYEGLRLATYDGHLEASTAVRLVGLLRDLASESPLEQYQHTTGKIATPGSLIDDLTAALTRAIEELTRPVDAIKHQAKTVTVGISRSDEGVLDRQLVQQVLAAGAGRDRLSYTTLKVLADLDPAVESVVGFTRYAIEGDPAHGATISIVDRGGMSRDVPSRVERNSQLRGTKRRVASERGVLVARGRSDGRTVIMVPEVKSGLCTGITLLHVRFHDLLPIAAVRSVLQGYDRRYDRLVDWVTETEGAFRDDLLAELSVVDLLILPISESADHWRRGE
ncbi:MAG: SIS domain-containing protein [Actinobacteria bacterium]|uniref:glutamine--fructose-6-phosphate transaminase (isomerizing) n=1 Tax=freshwater metagenome TaxID=449393 RepID=A0A6J7KFK5_9ZZZZ|nr:SIS domain-containing protein [Actinomycetota bacterium]MSW78956.1 SIS domain-containing protein [Actinomycetota bacterium]MSZ84253.1 SIS domain-containing protein [Actinomycetota bacterium]MTB19364.1 SIS domain-containing protein [Actinomycetota bacterium]